MKRLFLFSRHMRAGMISISALSLAAIFFLMRDPPGGCSIDGWKSGCSLPDDISVDILVDSEEFMTRLEDDMGKACCQVLIQTMSFEGDSAGRRLAHALESSPASDRKLLVDDYSRFIVNDKFKFFPKYWRDRDLQDEFKNTDSLLSDLRASGIRIRRTNPVDPFMVRFIARNHKKMVLVDHDIAYIGGINFCDHNFKWHDMMIRTESENVAEFLRRDFSATWNGTNLTASRDFGGLWLSVLDGTHNKAGFVPIIRAVEAARNTIFIESGYLTFPFFSFLRDAHDRGVRVVLLTPELNNKPIVKSYILWEALKAGIEVRLYPGRMNHLKAMLIDDSVLVFGSSNFDYISHAIQQEIIACITDRNVISRFNQRILVPDLERSEVYSASVSTWSGWPRFALIKGMGIVFAGLDRTIEKIFGSPECVEWEKEIDE